MTASAKPGTAPPPTVSSRSAAGAESPQKFSPRLLVYLAGGAVWLTFLAFLAATTSNPATLNLVQLRSSDVILVVQVQDQTGGQLLIEQVLKQTQPGLLTAGTNLQISPRSPHWKAGEKRIVPVQLNQHGTWEITPSPHPRTPQLDYPAEPRLIEQIQQMFPDSSHPEAP
jgi:hypothetical protein